MLVDSNVIIYAAMPQHAVLRDVMAKYAPAVSIVSKIEVLGWHKISEAEKRAMNRYFAATLVLPVDNDVADRAIHLRQRHKISLGDSLIAATALTTGRRLLTCNTGDFDWIDGLIVVDPLHHNLDLG